MSRNQLNHNSVADLRNGLPVRRAEAIISTGNPPSITNLTIQQAVRATGNIVWEFCQKCWRFQNLQICKNEEGINIINCRSCKQQSDYGKYDRKLLGFKIPQSDGNSQNEEIKQDQALGLNEEDLKTLNEAILCQICHSTMNLAKSLTSSCCAQTWCFACIIKSLKFFSACPNCKKLVTKPMLSKNRGMNDMYDTMKKFKCVSGYPKCIEHHENAQLY
jgi:hypothetical protein